MLEEAGDGGRVVAVRRDSGVGYVTSRCTCAIKPCRNDVQCTGKIP